MLRAPACQSKRRWFDSTSAVSKLGQFRSPHIICVLEESLKAVGPNSCVLKSQVVSCVSSRLGCLEYDT